MFSLGFILPVLIILWSSSSVFWRVYTTTSLIQLDEIRKKMIRKQWKVLLMVNIWGKCNLWSDCCVMRWCRWSVCSSSAGSRTPLSLSSASSDSQRWRHQVKSVSSKLKIFICVVKCGKIFSSCFLTQFFFFKIKSNLYRFYGVV